MNVPQRPVERPCQQSWKPWFTCALGGLLFAVYLYFLPELPGFSHYIYNHQRLLALLLFGVVAGLCLACGATRRDWLRVFFFTAPRVRIMLAALLALGLVSSLGAAYPWFGVLETASFALILLTSICVAVIRVRLGSVFDWLLAGALVVIGWEYLLDFTQYYLVVNSHGFDLDIVTKSLLSKFSNVRFFGQWQSWTLPLMVLPMLLVSRPLPWYLAFVFLLPAAGWWLLLLVTGTRGATFGSLVALVLTVLVYRRRALPWLRWHLSAAGAGMAAYLTLYHLLPPLWGVEATRAVAQGVIHRSTGGLGGRLPLWSSAGEMIGSHPLLGVGPMHFADYGHWIAAHPHSAPLQIAAEWGVPALVMVLLLLAYGLRTWLADDPGRKTTNPAPGTAALRPALFATLVTAAFHSLFSGIIVMPVSQVMMTLVLGWMLGIAYLESPVSRTWPTPAPTRRAQLLLVLFSVLVLAGIAKPLADQLPVVEQVHREHRAISPMQGRDKFRPRFWQQGHLPPYYAEPAKPVQNRKHPPLREQVPQSPQAGER